MSGIEEGIKAPVPAHQDPDRDTDKERHAEADGKMDQACLEVGKKRPLLHQADKRCKHIRGGGEDERVPDDDGGNELPDRQRNNDSNKPEPPVLAVILICPVPWCACRPVLC